VLLGVAVVAVRIVLYRDLPALVTADSWDYLQAAGNIFRHGDFFGPELRDVRLPGYPAVLALTHPLTRLRSDHVVLLQIGFGLASVALGLAIGALVGSPLVALTMMAFVGLSPVYLLHEHSIMCEAFALTVYLALVLAGLACLRPASGWRSWAALGVLTGLATVTRANMIALAATMAVGACVLRWTSGTRGLRCLAPALVASVVAFVLVAPWLWRNWSAYGRPVLYNSAKRNVVMYKSMHAPLDPTTPTLAKVNRRLKYDVVDYEWLWRLTTTYPSNRAEKLAGRILAEQIERHPVQHLRQMGETVAGFFGFKGYHLNERTGLLFLFRVMVGDVGRMNALALESPSAPLVRDWTYVPRAGDTPATRLFARWGSSYLLPGRAIGSVVVFCMLAAYLLWQAARRGGRDPGFAVVVALAVGYAATVAMHAVTLADYERYSTMFDFVLVLIAALIADAAMRAGRIAPRGRAASAVVLAAVGLLGCGGPKGVRDVNGDGRVVVACLGDSNTERHWPTPNSRKWCELAAAEVTDWTFGNYAVGGTTVTPPSDEHGWVGPQLDAALAEGAPDAVVLAFGTNDVRFGRSTAEVVDAYRAAVRRVEAARALAFVALAPPIFPPEPDHTAALAELNDALRAAFPAPRLVDFDGGMTRDDFESDGIHPTPAAQHKRAAAALRALRGG
jgi:lysophospholipase L1-like esterase